MIESIGVNHADMNEYQEIVLTQPELSGIIVKSIDGLGPAGANINFTELATIDGAIDNSARIETREIKLDLIFMTNQQFPLIEDVRLKTYKLFPVKKNITFYIKTDRRGLIHCYGRVEKNEPKIFQKQEGCTITIKCGDPFWHTDEQVNTIFFGVEPLFEFIYDNEGYGTKEVSGNQYDWDPCITVLNNSKYKGYVRDEDRIHVIVMSGTKYINSETNKPYYLYNNVVFDRYISRVPQYSQYIRPNEGYQEFFKNEEIDSLVKVDPETNEISIIAKVNPEFETTNRYHLKVLRTQMIGQGGTALTGYNTEMGEIHENDVTEGNVFYEGDADTGFIIDIIAKGNATKVQFFDKETGEAMELSDSIIASISGYGISQGDVITINSKFGMKSVTLLRDGKTYDLLNALVPTTYPDGTKRMEWLKLCKGNNVFAYHAETGLENLVFNVRYDVLYEGA